MKNNLIQDTASLTRETADVRILIITCNALRKEVPYDGYLS